MFSLPVESHSVMWLVSDSLHKIAFTVDTSTELYNMKGKRVLKKSYLDYFSHICVVH